MSPHEEARARVAHRCRVSTRTPWNGQWEGFHDHVVPREDGTLELIFRAAEQREHVKYTARRCHTQSTRELLVD